MINEDFASVLRGFTAQTVNAMKPCDWVFGTVTSASPLRIKISDKQELGEEFLILSDNVRDFETDIEVSHVTEQRGGGGGYAEFASHDHEYKGRKRITVYNGLKVGEQVVMLRQTGGQLFFVLNRVFNHIGLSGQWV